MTLTLILSMATFALVASLSPGPVNLVGFNTGLTHGWRPALWHVAGATLGFVVLLVAVGLGLHGVLAAWPMLLWVLRAAGALFLLYLAWKLARASGDLGTGQLRHCPGFRDVPCCSGSIPRPGSPPRPGWPCSSARIAGAWRYSPSSIW